jgi:hypothetical protein
MQKNESGSIAIQAFNNSNERKVFQGKEPHSAPAVRCVLIKFANEKKLVQLAYFSFSADLVLYL